MDVKELEHMPEMHELADLFAMIWGRPGEPPIDSSTLQALSHSGNYVVGAYSGERMVGGLIGWLEAVLQMTCISTRTSSACCPTPRPAAWASGSSSISARGAWIAA